MTYLRWAGSKKQILDTLSQAWYAAGCTGRYIEAFSGSAALFFYLRPKKATLIDCNAALQECMSTVKHRPIAIFNILQRYVGTSEEYYQTRSIDPNELTQEERAARFIYLNRYCFNGLYRTNSKGWFNVPYGGGKTGTLPSLDNLKYFSDVLKNAEIHCGDFYEKTLNLVTAGDFVYLDPPYARHNMNLDFQYGPTEFGEKDLEKLKKLVKEIHKRGAYFVISYAQCQEIKKISSEWHGFEVEVRRTIAASIVKRNFAAEILITNI